jgi:3-isopropylmalate/(R)-2-methylmalate dehydratase large subunit
MGMNIAEKILARQSGNPIVRPGDIVFVDVETCVLIDGQFSEELAGWRWPKKIFDPDKTVIVADHIVMAASTGSAYALRNGRIAAEYYGIKRFHDAGAGQGISHQVVADQAYALPGTVLACADSHTISGGAFNCCARGLGASEMMHILCTGKTWFRVGATVRYELYGTLPTGVTAKDAFLYLAGRWGSHENQNMNSADRRRPDFLSTPGERCQPCALKFPRSSLFGSPTTSFWISSAQRAIDPSSQHGRIRRQAMPTCGASIRINWCLTFQEMTV